MAFAKRVAFACIMLPKGRYVGQERRPALRTSIDVLPIHYTDIGVSGSRVMYMRLMAATQSVN